jgi:hypothetical protein
MGTNSIDLEWIGTQEFGYPVLGRAPCINASVSSANERSFRFIGNSKVSLLDTSDAMRTKIIDLEWIGPQELDDRVLGRAPCINASVSSANERSFRNTGNRKVIIAAKFHFWTL